MKRALIIALAGLVCVGACQTPRDAAEAEALKACAGKADSAAREACWEAVTAKAEAEARERMIALDAERLEGEKRDALLEAQGLPKQAR